MSNYQQEALRLLQVAKGQLDGIIQMMEDHQHCKDTANQIMATVPLLKNAQRLILKQHMEGPCNEYRKTESTPIA
ncbi:MAG: metal-sensing transcriptional repressor [Brevinema sp.]